MISDLIMASGRQLLFSTAAMHELNRLFLKRAVYFTLFFPVAPLSVAGNRHGRDTLQRQIDKAYELAYSLEKQRKIIRHLSERLARDAKELASLQQLLKGKIPHDENVICFADAVQERNRRNAG